MQVTGDLGFSSLVLVVVSLVFPVFGFIIRWKWRRSIARNEEIKRLLILASEETARAELEATQLVSSYVAVSASRNNYNHQCVVCYSPTTTRCARCKAVRYCSGKCQIIHWRQGHKEECRSASATHDGNDNGGDFSQKVAKQEEHNNDHDRYGTSPTEIFSNGPVLFNSSSTCRVSLAEDDGIKVDSVADASSVSDSTSTSFSGFSTSHSGGESSDDLSVTESISSNEFEGSDGQIYSDASDMLEPALNKVDQSKPVSPKFASLVDNVDSSIHLSKSKPDKTHCGDEESLRVSSSTLVQRSSAIPGASIITPGQGASGFWNRSLDSVVSSNIQCDPDLSNSNGPCKNKLSGSESFLHFKFDLSGSNAPSLDTKSSGMKGIIPDDALPASSGVDNSVNAAALSKNPSNDSPSIRSSTSASCQKYAHVDNESSRDQATELKSISSSTSYARRSASDKSELYIVDLSTLDLGDLRSQSSSSNKSITSANNTVSSSYLSKSGVSSNTSQIYLASNANGLSAASTKSGKVDNAEANSMISSQTISSPSSINGLKTSVRKVVDQFRGPKCGKYSDKGIFMYDLFVKLYTSNKVEMRPCGLINCGNSCYANVALQCLAFTPPLTSYFVQGFHSKECVSKEWCFTCEFESLMLKAKEGKTPLSPIGILSQLQSIGSQLGTGREEDAHEFLRYAIDKMQSVCLKETGVNGSGSSEEETTLIGLTFGGYLRSKIKCMKCHWKSERHERMMDLTVEIEGDIGKLEDALKRFTSTEILDGDNKYQCGRCNSYEKAKKKLTILEAPNVLTIALKRFQSGKFGKLNKAILFPEILNLAPYMSGTSDKSPIYRLYGVVVHLDIMNASFSGHYVCYVKNVQNKWFKIDDSTVTAVDLERVLTKGAYMLLYARCSPRAPRLLRNRIASSDPKMKLNPSRSSTKNTASNLKSSFAHPSAVQFTPNSIPPDNTDSVESFFLKFHRLQRILEEDSSSDSFSFTSSNSDEGSCSTESTRDSTSTEDLSDYIFGTWNTWRSASDSDTCSSSSSSPLYTRNSPDGSMDRVPGFWQCETSKECRKLESSSSCREANLGKVGVNTVKSGASYRRSVSERID
ncbi:ubiquitin carboxyl-terminal hydrolase 16 [Mercurialis annua]|uniref:ubiquitin carboxyl-terminal hydrolase 16 n=1 Tax=Mercurialis annua TaxID=3986 RepID=UPI00215F09C1|nr:ubiquitin carboxyl-terminal hydrolase 16 [Mercurialis annua]